MKTNYTLHRPRMPHFSRRSIEIALLIALIIVAALGVLLLLRPALTPAPTTVIAPAAVASQYNPSLAALKADQAERQADAAMVRPLPQAVTRADFAALKADQAERQADAAMLP